MLNILPAAAALSSVGFARRQGEAQTLLSNLLEDKDSQRDTPSEMQNDWRNIVNGWIIPQDPHEMYSDQPYVVITKDGNWLCVLTTGKGREGMPGQHVISTISSDKGRTWSPPVDIEPANGPEASWVMPLAIPSGRVYVFYTYNLHNLQSVISNDPKIARRVDTLGVYAMKYSDDYGRTWSAERYYIPMREMKIDRENAYGGKVLFFWGVGKPITTRYGAMFGFAKVGKWGSPGTMVTSQGCVMQSVNILTETDPRKIKWRLLPDGDSGLRAPKGPVSEETNLVELNDGSLYAVYRTIDGYLCQAYSRDGGHSWTSPQYATYTPNGRRIKHPRAAGFVKKFSNGKYLLWYHNHAGESVLTKPWNPYAGRNPGWLCGGIEKDGYIYWSQPEILLYDVKPDTKITYPDFVEDNGHFFITETDKSQSRVHPIDRSLLDGLWNQGQNRTTCQRGLAFSTSGKALKSKTPITMPTLPSLDNGGFTVEFWASLHELTAGQTIIDTRTPEGKGIAIVMSDRATWKLILSDGLRQSTWDSDPGIHEGTLRVGVQQHVAFVVDGGPKLITVMVDGVLNDGGAVRDFGWGRFDPELKDVNGVPSTEIAPNIFGNIGLLRIYNRYLRTSELFGNWQAGIR